jgi:hypothetical protein
MKYWTAKQEPYLRESVATRLGELAANLAQIQSFSNNDLNRDAVAHLIEESKFFIEWTAIDAGINQAAELVELQVQLASWQLSWSKIWADDVQRTKVAQQAKVWSESLLEMSGLLSEPVTSASQCS